MAPHNNRIVGIVSILVVFLVIPSLAHNKAVELLCSKTRHNETCNAKLAGATNSTDTKELVEVAFNVAMQEISNSMRKSKLLQEAAKDTRTSRAFKACEELLEDSKGDIQRAVDRLVDYASAVLDINLFMNDLKIWLSGALTFEQTCLDGFRGTKGDNRRKMQHLLKTAQQLTGNTLEMVGQVHEVLKSFDFGGFNLNGKVSTEQSGLPSWASSSQRHLLQAKAALNPDVVVAKDGSGKYKTINEALHDVPLDGAKPFVIHIKAGVYAEYVTVTGKMKNVVFVGDGATKTKITGDRSFVGGYQTSASGTVTIMGDGFIAKDIGIENTAGAKSHQAVALRVQADRSIFFNCQFDGYQDTLYVHAHRQFYRDCTITGTVDFIFGNAAAVFQNCHLVIRKPLVEGGSAQACMVTAQGRMQPDEPTGIVIVNSDITAAPEYLSSPNPIVSFLGRPWRQYSRTVILNTKIDAPIAPEGWSPFQGTFGLDDCYYAELGNTGKGADVSKRAKWPGIKASITKQEAEGFLPGKFILGDTWIPNSGVPYAAGFM